MPWCRSGRSIFAATVCRLWYDSSPCPSSSSVLPFFFLKAFQVYIGREKAIQKEYRAKNEKELIQHKKKGNTVEREK